MSRAWIAPIVCLAVVLPCVGGGERVSAQTRPNPEGGLDLSAVAWSLTGDVLATGDERGNVQLLAGDDGRRLATFRAHEGRIRELAFMPDGALVTAGTDGRTREWDREGHSLADREGRRGAVAFAADGTQVAFADRSSATEFTPRILVQRLDAEGASYALEGKGIEATALAFSPDGRLLAASSALDTAQPRVWIWDLAARRLVRELVPPTDVNVVAFAPHSEHLATGGNADLIVWDVATGGRLRTLARGEPAERVYALAFSPDGHLLYAGGRFSGLQAYDLERGRVRSLQPAGTSVLVLALSRDGERIASLHGRWGLAIRVFETETGRVRW